MAELIVQLLPVALTVMLSPLAIMALVAILLSPLARVNGVAYLLGWVVGLAGLMALSFWVLRLVDVRPLGAPPPWVALLRIVLAAVLIAGAVWVYRKGAARVRRMAAAQTPHQVAMAATLPGWLQKVSTFRPARCFLLGVGLFVTNPVDASCAIIAALDISLATVTPAAATAAAAGFIVLGVLPIAIPVVWVIVAGHGASDGLGRVRTWIAGNTHVLNAALLLVVGVLQLDKAVTALV